MYSSFPIICYLCLVSGLNLHAQMDSIPDKNDQAIIEASRFQRKRATTMTSKALRIGDKVPDFVMHKVFNYQGDRVQFSTFRGKLLILDFWHRGCGPCIASFPRMDSLQERFNDKIQILSVNVYDTHERLNLGEPGFPQASKSDFIRSTKLPMVFNSLEMADYFPHYGEPYLVLVNPDGYVIAMTDASAVNAATVRSVLSGEQVEFPLSNSFRRALLSIDFQKSILEEGNGRLVKRILYLKRSAQDPEKYLLLAKLGIIGNPMSMTILDTIDNKPVRVGYRQQSTLLNLYNSAYGFIHPQFIIVESDYPQRYYPPKNALGVQEWANDNTYTIECRDGGHSNNDSLQLMLQQTLSVYFTDIRTYKSRRLIKCMILYRTSSRDKVKTRFPNKHTSKENISAAAFFLRNFSFSSFISALQYENVYANGHLAVPILDETGYTGNIDIDIRRPGDIAGLNAQLAVYDLGLKEEEREIEVLVISDRVSTLATSSVSEHP